MSIASTKRYDKADVARAASGRWHDIMPALAEFNPEHLDGNGYPCPICRDGDDRFNTAKDFSQTGACHCRACNIGGDGFTALMKANNWTFPETLRAVGEFLNVQPISNGHPQRTIAEDAERFHQMALAQNKLKPLSESLGVSVDALIALRAGWNGEAWTFPETDAAGEIIGIIRRMEDGSKKACKGSKRGLMIADDGSGDSVYSVEGATDSAAMIDLGLPIVSRFSANGGGALLVELFKDDPRQIVIVGENDQKEDGTWPGLKGAISIARKLVKDHDNIRIGMPGDDAKDVRAWLKQFADDGDFLSSLKTFTVNEAADLLTTHSGNEDRLRTYELSDRNDIGNAAHFVSMHSDKLLHCFKWKKWLHGDGCRWQLDDDGTPWRLAKATVQAMFHDGMEGRDGQIMQLASDTASAGKLSAMIKLAAPELPVRVDDLDQNEWLLNCPNGTLDLRTGVISPHKRWQNITVLCPTEFNPNATAPKWEQFLRDIFADDDELIGFVQRYLGYCLTGDVSEQNLPIFHGNGSNGKTTLLNSFMNVVGDDYAMQADTGLLMEKKGESHPTEKAALFGKRFVSCVETDSSRKLAEATVKTLTGGDKITARRMREDFWTFDPTHKLVLCTNHKPIIVGNDHGIWRRLLLVPFDQRFEGKRIDKQLPEKLTAEADGILAWLVRGCLDWQGDGLNPPEVVSSATADYRTGEDPIGRFIEERCEISASAILRFSVMYDRFTTWAEDAGEFVPAKRSVGVYLREHGYEKFTANGTCYRGLDLKPAE
jgi:putative DNA primase/helicase